MKRIEAVIGPARVPDICAALDSARYQSLTITAAEGRERRKGWVNLIRGGVFTVNLLQKARVEVVAQDEDVDEIINAIREAALTAGADDGTIFIHDVRSVLSLRPGSSGTAL